MATSGYSGTPLLKKLGIDEGKKLWILYAPPGYLNNLERDIRPQIVNEKTVPDIVHLFVKSQKEFLSEMKKLQTTLKKNTAMVIWVSWYKKSAKIPTDITEDVIRDYALRHQLVDVKVCAVDEQWSGLKLVVPLSKRSS